jgi:hypothetical protein
VRVPLSEREQRILRQIEQELAADPSFADRATRIPRHRLALLTVFVVAGLVATVLALSVSFWLAFGVFVGVLTLGALLEQELRVVGRDKLGSLSVNAWLTGARPNRRSE